MFKDYIELRWFDRFLTRFSGSFTALTRDLIWTRGSFCLVNLPSWVLGFYKYDRTWSIYGHSCLWSSFRLWKKKKFCIGIDFCFRACYVWIDWFKRRGKTTLVKTILGLKTPISGSVSVLVRHLLWQMSAWIFAYLPERFDPLGFFQLGVYRFCRVFVWASRRFGWKKYVLRLWHLILMFSKQRVQTYSKECAKTGFDCHGFNRMQNPYSWWTYGWAWSFGTGFG